MIEIFVSVATGISVAGALCVAHNKSAKANYLWSLSNIVFIINTYLIKQYSMMAMFFVYEAIALYGIYKTLVIKNEIS